MPRIEEVAQPVFARHETFHPRYGWFRKGVKAAQESHTAFTQESATVELGVGKNMVRAIRFWGKAAKLLTDDTNPDNPRLPYTVPSIGGIALFDDDGLDPYLELPGSLWLLQWLLLATPCMVPVWWLTFHQFSQIEFTDEELSTFVWQQLSKAGQWTLPVQSSVRKDVDCLLHMYAPRVSERVDLDDLIDCPFRELGLLTPVRGERKRYRFLHGQKSTLPPSILAYACFDFLATTSQGERTCTLNRLTRTPGSPGRAFRLSDEALRSSLEAYVSTQANASITAVAGIPQLTLAESPADAAEVALNSYYSAVGRGGASRRLRLDSKPARRTERLFDTSEEESK